MVVVSATVVLWLHEWRRLVGLYIITMQLSTNLCVATCTHLSTTHIGQYHTYWSLCQVCYTIVISLSIILDCELTYLMWYKVRCIVEHTFGWLSNSLNQFVFSPCAWRNCMLLSIHAWGWHCAWLIVKTVLVNTWEYNSAVYTNHVHMIAWVSFLTAWWGGMQKWVIIPVQLEVRHWWFVLYCQISSKLHTR